MRRADRLFELIHLLRRARRAITAAQDVLVRFEPGARRTLFDMVRMQHELSRIFGRHVDLVTRAAVEGSRNHIRKKAILESSQVIHAARRQVASAGHGGCGT